MKKISAVVFAVVLYQIGCPYCIPAVLGYQQIKKIIIESILFFDSFPKDLQIDDEKDKNNIAGYAIIILNKNTFLILYRLEINKIIRWGGNPNNKDNKDIIEISEPRNSFKEWKQHVSGKCIEWDYKIDKIIKFIFQEIADYFSTTYSDIPVLLYQDLKRF